MNKRNTQRKDVWNRILLKLIGILRSRLELINIKVARQTLSMNDSANLSTESIFLKNMYVMIQPGTKRENIIPKGTLKN